MQLVPGSERIVVDGASDPVRGAVRWAPVKSIWIGSMTATALVAGPIYFTWSAFLLFLATSAVTLCAGHSVGMHRRLIHNSFQCPLWLEHVCVYLGVLVGMAGPIGMMRIHDLRDWAQRQPVCHDYFGHRASFWKDAWHQLHCELALERSPRFELEARVSQDRFFHILERSWMVQQLPWALLFLAIGGLPWVVWGICVRVSVCVTGHWLVGHYAHREGSQTWLVDGASVQGHDVRIAGLISMGESWHNNHHAFPGSARIGLEPGQADLGWLLIRAFETCGLAWAIVLPEHLPRRPALRRVAARGVGCRIAQRLFARG
ncbi:acyl-CoA desaturase [Sphingosinicella terrae]|uniref:acyl-CoA desaturase n=1 Tax=Sphingosinicella terrae TaxID=2172047 RepID=UPI000E0D152F|nr:acyl-CoA desaturase [Sphingosinicella terrae]